MKRLALLVAVLALLSACSTGDDAVVTVNGQEAVTVDQLDELLDEVGEADDLLAAQSIRGSGAGTLRSAWVSSVLIDNLVLSEILRQDLAEDGIDTEPADAEAGEVILESTLANPQDGSGPVTLDQLPEGVREAYLDLYARFTARIRGFGGDTAEIIAFDPTTGGQLSEATTLALQQAQERVGELRQTAEVEVDPAWGRWVADGTTAGVEPPEGPVAPATTLPLALPTGG